MVHTYEVLVNIRECSNPTTTVCHNETARYEIDAESVARADSMARIQARHEHPHGTEYDSRVTRLLR
jgi:hypothetical protein